MSTRPRPTLFDYSLTAFNPLLIMIMVGSLTYFLVELFYEGAFNARLNFIFTMFVMGIVLIARISIENGTEYAALFAIPMGGLTFLALQKFVTFPGHAAAMSPVINLGLMSLLWWMAHRITWDCTYLDESERAPGEGLLQTAGLDGAHLDGSRQQSAQSPQEDEELDVQASTGVPATDNAGWWQRYKQRMHRPHAHGLWVIYFALLAIPVFGLGQGFLNSLDSRRYALQLFLMYMASALGLLMTTSLLGLRRYLRQRHLEMPLHMPAIWFGVGSTLIVALLLACLLLPRPGAEYSVSHLSSPPTDDPARNQPASSPTATGTQATAQQTTGPQGNEQQRSGQQSSGQQSSGQQSSGQQSSGQQSSDQQSSDQQSSDQQSSGRQSSGRQSSDRQSSGQQSSGQQSSGQQSSDRQSSGQESNGQQSNGQQSSGQQSSGQPSNNRLDGSQPTGQRKDGQQPSDQQADGQQAGNQQAGNQQAGNQQAGNQQAGNQQAGNQQASDGRPSDTQQSPDRSSRAQQLQQADERQASTPARNQPPTPSNQPPPAGRQTQDDSRAEPSEAGETDQGGRPAESDEDRSSAESRPSQSPQSAQSPNRTGVQAPRFSLSIASVLKLMYYVLLLAGAVYVVWRYADQLRQVWRQMVRDLQAFWRRLFGAHRIAAADEQPATVAAVLPSFVSFASPFAPGARAMVDAELLRYSFAALEAWARDRGLPRGDEETPLEFTQRLARDVPDGRSEIADLGKLYSQLAYGGGPLPQGTRQRLRNFWTTIQTLGRAASPVG